MEISFRSRAIAEVSDGNSVLIVNSIFVARSSGLGHLSAQWRGHSHDVMLFGSVMNRHLFTFTEIILVSSQLMSHLFDVESTPEEAPSFSVLRED